MLFKETWKDVLSSVARGEIYDAALLDTVHTAEHVMKEFERATQLVRAGGLILIHDAVFPYGTVSQALEQIDGLGYGVIQLWTTEGCTREDGGLGLAIIENSRRSRIAIP